MTRFPVSLMRPKGVTEPGSTPSISMSRSGLPKDSRREPMRAGSGFEVDPRILEADDQPDRTLLVLEKQVLAMAAGDLAAQRAGLLDGEDGRVIAGRGLDAEAREAGHEVGAGGGIFAIESKGLPGKRRFLLHLRRPWAIRPARRHSAGALPNAGVAQG